MSEPALSLVAIKCYLSITNSTLCGALSESKVDPKPALFKDYVCTKPGDTEMEFVVQLLRLDFTGRTVLLFLMLNF